MPLIPAGQSITVVGSATAPAANATLVTGIIAAQTLYRAHYKIFVDGTVTAADDDNFLALLVGAGTFTNNLQCAAGLGVSEGELWITSPDRLGTNQQLLIRAKAAASASAVYHAMLILTPYQAG